MRFLGKVYCLSERKWIERRRSSAQQAQPETTQPTGFCACCRRRAMRQQAVTVGWPAMRRQQIWLHCAGKGPQRAEGAHARIGGRDRRAQAPAGGDAGCGLSCSLASPESARSSCVR